MKRPPQNPFFKKESFINYEVGLIFLNTTTQTEMRHYGRTKIIELGEDWITIQAPKGSCNREHKLLVHIFSKDDTPKIKKADIKSSIPGAISITAVVKDFEVLKSDKIEVTIKFLQYSVRDWNKFLSKWKEVQEKVDQMIKKIKGVD